MRLVRTLVKVAVVGAVSYAAYRAVQHLAPQGVDRFVRDVRDGMAEREAQLREALGAEALGDEASHSARHAAGARLTATQARDLLDDPAGLHPGAPEGRSVPPYAPQARAGQG